MTPTPEAAAPLPLKGAPPAAWQSQIRGGRSEIHAGNRARI
jgi:hypothetical protein